MCPSLVIFLTTMRPNWERNLWRCEGSGSHHDGLGAGPGVVERPFDEVTHGDPGRGQRRLNTRGRSFQQATRVPGLAEVEPEGCQPVGELPGSRTVRVGAFEDIGRRGDPTGVEK